MKTRIAPQLLWPLALAGAVLLAAVLGYQQARHDLAAQDSDSAPPPPTSPKGLGLAQIDFPPQPEADAAKDAEGVPSPAERLNQIWETNAKQPLALLPQPLTEPNWTITGVVQQGDQVRVMVLFQGEPQARFYKVGDVLPGGSKLAWVKPGAIGVVTPKRQKVEVPILESSNPPAPQKTPASPGKAPR